MPVVGFLSGPTPEGFFGRGLEGPYVTQASKIMINPGMTQSERV